MTSTPDPADLQRQIAALQAQLAALQAAPVEPPPVPAVSTSGGAAFHGPMHADNLVGRDQNLHIAQLVQLVVADPSERTEAEAVIAQYLDGLVADLTGLRLYNVDEAIDTQQAALELRDVYVPLDTQESIPKEFTLAEWRARRSRIPGGLGADAEPSGFGLFPVKDHRLITALEALAYHDRLTLLGRAGSGKSTFGAWVLLVLAQGLRGKVEVQAELGDTWSHGRLLPIRIVLREFAAALPPDRSAVNAGHLWAHVARSIGTRYSTAERTLRYLQAVARERGALFLLDGLDECGAQRDRVNASIEDLMRHWGGKSRFLRTARPSAWPQGAQPDQGVYALAELSPKKVASFIDRWYAAVQQRGWPLRRPVAQMVEDLTRACGQRDIRPLAASPLLLTLMALIHTTRARLPDDRAELYGSAVDLLLQRWNDADDRNGSGRLCQLLGIPDFPLDNVKEVLAKVAFQVHAEQAPHVGEDRLKRAFRGLTSHSDDRAAQLIDYIEERAGLLICDQPKGDDPEQERLFSFPHRTFQEYLAALHLAKFHPDGPAKACELAEGQLTQWEVVLPLMARIAGPAHGASLADALIRRRSVQDQRRKGRLDRLAWQRALLAGLQLQEIGRAKVVAEDDRLAILERVTDWLVELLPVLPDQGGLEAPLRARAGDVLSALGDPRFDPDRYYLPRGDDLGFVAIPGRSDLRFARYLTTVAQFRAYLAATGREAGDPDALRDPDQRPVRWVNQAEALAYCAWLTESGLLPIGWRADLPEELEWEHASRGGQPKDSNYWWGNDPDPERANYADSGIGDTSVVGCVPANGFGLSDMLGNVLEWTRSLWSEAESNPILRGGAFLHIAACARCAVCFESHPAVRYIYGFRVVLRCSPV